MEAQAITISTAALTAVKTLLAQIETIEPDRSNGDRVMVYAHAFGRLQGLAKCALIDLEVAESFATVACVDCGQGTKPYSVTGEHRCASCVDDLRFHD